MNNSAMRICLFKHSFYEQKFVNLSICNNINSDSVQLICVGQMTRFAPGWNIFNEMRVIITYYSKHFTIPNNFRGNFCVASIYWVFTSPISFSTNSKVIYVSTTCIMHKQFPIFNRHNSRSSETWECQLK